MSFDVLDLSGVAVVATKLEQASVLLHWYSAVVSCIFSKVVVEVVEHEWDDVLKSVADKFSIHWLAVGIEPESHASFSSEAEEYRDDEPSRVTVTLWSEVGVEAHPGVDGDESRDCKSPHYSARSLQARTTPSWLSKKGRESQSYFAKNGSSFFGSGAKEDVTGTNVERTRLKW